MELSKEEDKWIEDNQEWLDSIEKEFEDNEHDPEFIKAINDWEMPEELKEAMREHEEEMFWEAVAANPDRLPSDIAGDFGIYYEEYDHELN